jgi:WD40 repeat protein
VHLPEFDLLVTSSSDQSLRFWDTNVESAHYLEETSCWQLNSPQLCLAWADFILFSANSRAQIVLWDVERREVRHVLLGHSDMVMDLLVLPLLSAPPQGWPRRILASCSVDATIRLWDVHGRKELRVFRGHRKAIMSLAYCDFCEYLISGGADPFLLLWSLECAQAVQQIPVKNPQSLIVSIVTIPGTPEMITCDANV